MSTEQNELNKCAEGVAKALLREQLDESAATKRKLDDIELRLVALARKRGMSEQEIRAFLKP